MMTVRFDTGVAVQYNDAGYCERSANYSDLYKDSTKKYWIVQVPNSALIETTQPCRVYNPISNSSDGIKNELADLTSKVRGLTRKISQLTKKEK